MYPALCLSYGGPIISELRYRRGFLNERQVLTKRHHGRLIQGGVKLLPTPVSNVEDISLMLAELRESDQKFRLVESPDEMDAVTSNQRNEVGLTFCLGPQKSGDPPFMMETYLQLGVTMFSMTHNRRNLFADGCGEPSDGGLSHLGRQLVKTLERLGIVIDISHISPRSFWQAIELVDAPLVATHSNCRAVHDHPRNLSDDQILALAERGGYVGLNFHPDIVGGTEPDLSQILRHFDHLMELVGPKHIALGPDFQDFALDIVIPLLQNADPEGSIYGRNQIYPAGAEDVTKMPNVIEALRELGLGAEDLDGVCGENVINLFKLHADTRSAAKHALRP
jgi:membrane dipeptidase